MNIGSCVYAALVARLYVEILQPPSAIQLNSSMPSQFRFILSISFRIHPLFKLPAIQQLAHLCQRKDKQCISNESVEVATTTTVSSVYNDTTSNAYSSDALRHSTAMGPQVTLLLA